jgi:perosamine synthetase
MLQIYNPSIDKYTSSAKKAIDSGWISNHGEFVEKATNKLNEVLNSKYSILMSNGTCATHCLFLSLKKFHPEVNTVYIPNNAYVAAWNSALCVYNPESLKVMKMDENTWNVCTSEETINSLEYGAAVLIVHNLGNIINVPRLKKIRPDLIFVEDNCEGLFGKYNDVYSGTGEHVFCSSISFYGNKVITTGEGGAFLTNNEEVYNYIKGVYSQGMSSTKYLHNVHAYNYRMTNIQAAFLYDQLNDIDFILDNKKEIFSRYFKLCESLIESDKIRVFKKEENTENACWIFSIRILNNTKSINETMDFFKERGIDVRPFFYPIHMHTHLNYFINEDPVSYTLNKEILMIPSSPDITIEEQEKVIEAVRTFVQ